MKETLKAFLTLDKAGLLLNAEKAARLLGLHELVSTNHTAALWAMAEADVPLEGTSMVGSEPVVEIATEPPPGGQRSGVRPSVKHVRSK